MKKTLTVLVFLGWQLSLSFVPDVSSAQTAQEFGIDRSNLTRESEAVREKDLRDISSLHAAWFRDVLSGTTPDGIVKFVNEVKLAKQNNLKFLANILPLRADYDNGYQNPNAGEDFRKRCGWTQGSSQISRIDLAKVTQRLHMQFDAVKAANLTIDAFEIGNEVDWICFNGDVPDGHAATEAEFMTAVRGYAHFLKTAAEVIHDPRYFPNGKIITFGIAHGSDRWDRPPHHFSNPARMIAMLRNLDGFNYLDNTLYHVDGYGTHIYPNPDNLQQSVMDLVRQDAAILGPDKPFWITEWGLAANRYPNKQRQTRSQAFKDFYDTLNKLRIPFGPPFYYAHSPGGSSLIDANGALLPEAKALAFGGGGQSIFPILPPTRGADPKARDVIVGVNIWNEKFLSETAQENELKHMAASGVKIIRTGLVDYNMEFIIKAHERGISSVVIVFPFRGSKTGPMSSCRKSHQRNSPQSSNRRWTNSRWPAYAWPPLNLEMRSTRPALTETSRTPAADVN